MLQIVPSPNKLPCGCAVDWAAASRAASEILRDVYRVDLFKALDPLNDADFLTIAQSIADDLLAVSAPLDKKAMRRALQVLDVDWADLSDAQIAAVVDAANLGLAGLPAEVAPKVTSKLKIRLKDTIGSTKVSAVAALNLSVSTSLNLVDTQMADSLSRLGTWITTEYNTRLSSFSTGANQIVADGLAQGLRSGDITQDLQALGDKISVKRPAHYWRLVALNSANRARSYGHLSTMSRGGIVNYIFSAVVDKRTSNICRSLDGTVFPVSTGMAKFSDLELQSPLDFEAAEKIMPFVRDTRLPNGEIEMSIAPPGGGRTVLGIMSRSGVGRADFKPPVRELASPSQLAGAGVAVPPIHQACRSTIIADI